MNKHVCVVTSMIGVGILTLLFSTFGSAGVEPETPPEYSEEWFTYQRTMHENLKRSRSVTDFTRAGWLPELGLIRGHEAAQVLRLLRWASETDPAIRKELLTQWLCAKDTVPPQNPTRKRLLGLVQSLKEEVVTQRGQEIDEVYANIDAECATRQAEAALVPQVEQGVQVEGCPQLDELSEDILFAEDAVRHRAISDLSPPREREGGDELAQPLFRLLWFFEPTPDTRKVIEQRLIKSYEKSLRKLYTAEGYMRLFPDFKENERNARVVSIMETHREMDLEAQDTP